MLSFALIKKKTCKKSWKLHVVCVICENTLFSRFLGGHLGGHLGLRQKFSWEQRFSYTQDNVEHHQHT